MYLSGLNPLKVFASDKQLFSSLYINTFLRSLYYSFTGQKLRTSSYAGHKVLSHKDGNECLRKAILSGEPFMFGRLGACELGICSQVLYKSEGIRPSIDMTAIRNASNCGFFADNEEEVFAFYEEIMSSLSDSDTVGLFFWGGIPEDYYIKRYCKKDVELTHGNIMDFWKFEKPFTSALAGKKVLVISPLAELIEKQYVNREKLFENPNVLPQFELKTVKAIQSIMGNRDPRASSWADGIEYMFEEAMKHDFDVALLGCGSYGTPLAKRLRSSGKVVIYMGGVLQMLFGIRGKRWDSIPEARALYNEYWVTPDGKFKPRSADECEDGCYW